MNVVRDENSCKHSKHAWGTNKRKWGTNFGIISWPWDESLAPWDCLTKDTSLRLTHWDCLSGAASKRIIKIDFMRLPFYACRFLAIFEERSCPLTCPASACMIINYWNTVCLWDWISSPSSSTILSFHQYIMRGTNAEPSYLWMEYL